MKVSSFLIYMLTFGLLRHESDDPPPDDDIPILDTLGDDEKAAAEATRIRHEEACKTLELQGEEIRTVSESIIAGDLGRS